MQVALKCRNCNEKYADSEIRWRCACGGLLDIETDQKFSQNQIITNEPNLWRYKKFLPTKSGSPVSFGEGWTPIIKDDKNLQFKLDYLMPSGSFKDRGASVLVSKMQELKITQAVEDSSGNAGKAIASYCARAGIDCRIIVPKSTSQKKMKLIRETGARIDNSSVNRSAAAEKALRIADEIYYASHSWNPYFLQGTKTIIYEIFEQMKQMPERIIVPVGNGTLILGIYLGLEDLINAGLLDAVPEIIGVQSSQCAPLVDAFEQGKQTLTDRQWQDSIANGISVSQPIRAAQILEFTDRFKSHLIAISDEKIQKAYYELHEKGYLIETTAATAYAAYQEYFNDKVSSLIILTGRE